MSLTIQQSTKPQRPKDLLHDIAFDYRMLATFCEDQFAVRMGDEEVLVGQPYLGGISRLVFERSLLTNCRGCGKCCRNSGRRTWFYFDHEEPRPQGLVERELVINGVSYTIWTFTSDPEACLMQDEVGHCIAHTAGVKPAHCAISFPVFAKNLFGRLDVLTNQKVGRNHRWPQCPLNPSDTVMDDVSKAIWRRTWALWAVVLKEQPSSRFEQIHPILLDLLDHPERFDVYSKGQQVIRWGEVLMV